MALVLVAVAVALPTPPANSQIAPGASLSVLRGSVAVSRPDGTAVYPAGTGLTLAIGDSVGTLERTHAIVTFFTGSEVELGSNTTMVIRQLQHYLLGKANVTGEDVTGPGTVALAVGHRAVGQVGRDLSSQASVTVENVAGLLLIRVPPGAGPGAAIRVLGRDTVALVRSGEVGHGVDPTTNNVTVACVDGCTRDGLAFPTELAFVPSQTARTVTGRGDVVDRRVPVGASVWDVLAERGSLGREDGDADEGRADGDADGDREDGDEDGDEDGNREDGDADDDPRRPGPATPAPVSLCFGRVPTVVYPLVPGGAAPGPGDDVILGTDGPDTINAAAGNDIVCGLGGDDTINGGGGDDVIDGGDGDDVINGGGGMDTCTGGPGVDTVACAVVTDPLP